MAVKIDQLRDNADTFIPITKTKTAKSLLEKCTVSYLKFKVNSIKYITGIFLEEEIQSFL